MTAPLLIEEESGTSAGHRHPHSGYYAGDFSGRFDAATHGVPTRVRSAVLRPGPSVVQQWSTT